MFKHSIFTILLILGFNLVSNAQLEVDWGHSFGEASFPGVNTVRSAVQDASGNVYSIGYFSGTMDVDPGAGTTNLVSAGAEDIFIVKYSSTGAVVWGRSIGSTGDDFGFGIAIDGSDNTYITGSFRGTVDFDPGAGTANLNSGGASNEGIFVMKLNSSGVYQWAHHFGSTNADRGYGIATDPSGNVYTTGYFNGTVDFDPGAGTSNLVSGNNEIYVSKLSSAGTFVWVKQFVSNGSWDVGYGIDLDASNNIYIAGTYSGTIDLDPNAGTSNFTGVGQRDVFVCKLDASGNYITGFNVGGAQHDNCYDIEVGANEFYITGSFEQLADFNPGAGINYLFGAGFTEAFVAKFDLNGNYLWATQFAGTGVDVGYSVAIDASGNVLTTGKYSSTVDFCPGYAIYNIANPGGNSDVFISKISSGGEFIYARGFGGGNDEVANCVLADVSGDIYLAGNLTSQADIDPSSAVVNINTSGLNAAFIAKYTSCIAPISPGSVIGDTLVCQNSINTFSVNPVPGATSYGWFFNQWTGSSTTNSIDLTSNAAGIYISVVANNGCGSSPLSTVMVYVQNLPTPTGSIIGPDTVCFGDSVAYSIPYGGFSSTINWQFPSGWSSTPVGIGFSTDAFVNGLGGNIIVQGSNICGSTVPETLYVHVNEIPALTGNDVSICMGDQAQLEATTSGGTIYWHTNSFHSDTLTTGPLFITNPLFNDTVFYVTSNNNNGCSSSPDLILNVVVNPFPDINTTSGFNSVTADQTGAMYQWLDCNNSFNIISGETSQSYNIFSNGSYAVEINLNGCVDTSSCITINNVGIENMNTSELVVYPNPTVDLFSIAGNLDVSAVEILDITGKSILLFSPALQYNIESLRNGTYIVKITSGEHVILTQLIKL
jgi:PKD-like domain/Ig-like domain CHU_C associated/Secretion system C-terminal sorting domain/Beta-propeller repeat